MIKIDYAKLSRPTHTVTGFLVKRGYREYVDWTYTWEGTEMWVTVARDLPEAETLLRLAYGHAIVED